MDGGYGGLGDFSNDVGDNPAILLDGTPRVDPLQTIVLALLQGVTEFLPVSSAAHLILATELTGWPDQGLGFDIAVHLGALLAVLAYYRQDCGCFAAGAWGYLRHRRYDANLDLLLKIVLASLPVTLAGFALYDLVAKELRDALVVAGATLLFGLALWWADGKRGERSLLGWGDALLIGLAQALAIVPGTSRSGVTITAALLLGFSRPAATRVAFLLAIPAIGGAAWLAANNLPQTAQAAAWFDLALGAAVAAVSAYLCIWLFAALLERTGLRPYAYYRMALGTALLLLTALPA